MGPGRAPRAQSLSVNIVFHQDNATWLILLGSESGFFLVNTLSLWVSPRHCNSDTEGVRMWTPYWGFVVLFIVFRTQYPVGPHGAVLLFVGGGSKSENFSFFVLEFFDQLRRGPCRVMRCEDCGLNWIQRWSVTDDIQCLTTFFRDSKCVKTAKPVFIARI